MATFGVNLVGHFDAAVGLGEAARASVRALDATGIPCVLNNCDLGDRHRAKGCSELSARISDDAPFRFDLVHLNPNSIPEYPWVFAPKRRQGHYRIGYWLWETLKFPPEWTFAFNLFDEIWTSSSFCVESISRVSPIPVIRVPLAVGTPSQARARVANISSDKFVFLFIFDFCSAYTRKNPLAVIRSFLAAFGADDRVLLFIKSVNADVDVIAKKEMRKAISGAKNIKWVNDLLPKADIRALMDRANCYVSLHRAEGYGLTVAEAMSLSKPVIATGYSGNLDLMTTSNSYPVRYVLTQIKEGRDAIYRDKKEWAEPDEAHAAQLMRHVFEDQDDARQKGARAAETIETHFSPAAVGQLIKARLETIDSFRSAEPLDVSPEQRMKDLHAQLRSAEVRSEHLAKKVSGMEASRFWKVRNLWFDVKRRLHIIR